MSTLRIETAKTFKPLLEPSRYKGAYGGRGSGKSHFFAGKLIEDSMAEPGLLSVCIREIQKSLKDSAHRLITQKLEDFGLGARDGFRVYKTEIQTPGDGIIVFQGMQDHTADSIKSLEGFKRAWIEEAQTVSERSLKLLRPTIRAPGSEIWASWNPRRKTDPIDQMLRGDKLPRGAVVVQANWTDNPWFTPELNDERLDCLETTPDEYQHIWEGDYETVTKGAYYAKHLTLARAEGRLTDVAADPLFSRRAFVDIGGTGSRADAFTIWICQFVGQKILVIDYYEAQGQELGAHLDWLRSRGHTTSNTGIWLPHDGSTQDRVYSVSYESEFKRAGYNVTVIPNQGKGAAKNRIEMARRWFNRCWFDKHKCRAGLDALASYHEKRDDVRGIGLGPNHDWSSHAADSFGAMAVVYKEPTQRKGWDKQLKPNTMVV